MHTLIMFRPTTSIIDNQKRGYTDHLEASRNLEPNTKRSFLVIVRTSKERNIRHNHMLHL
jgi:hypothetical protein